MTPDERRSELEGEALRAQMKSMQLTIQQQGAELDRLRGYLMAIRRLADAGTD